jgi:hypothetical protein
MKDIQICLPAALVTITDAKNFFSEISTFHSRRNLLFPKIKFSMPVVLAKTTALSVNIWWGIALQHYNGIMARQSCVEQSPGRQLFRYRDRCKRLFKNFTQPSQPDLLLPDTISLPTPTA